MFVQQHKHLRRCGGADALASLLMLCACFGAGNHPYKPRRSRMDAVICAWVVTLAGRCSMDLPRVPCLAASTRLCRGKNKQTTNMSIWFINPMKAEHCTAMLVSDTAEPLVLLWLDPKVGDNGLYSQIESTCYIKTCISIFTGQAQQCAQLLLFYFQKDFCNFEGRNIIGKEKYRANGLA